VLCYKLQSNLYDLSDNKLFEPGYAVTRGNGFLLAKLMSTMISVNIVIITMLLTFQPLCHLPFDSVLAQSICPF